MKFSSKTCVRKSFAGWAASCALIVTLVTGGCAEKAPRDINAAGEFNAAFAQLMDQTQSRTLVKLIASQEAITVLIDPTTAWTWKAGTVSGPRKVEGDEASSTQEKFDRTTISIANLGDLNRKVKEFSLFSTSVIITQVKGADKPTVQVAANDSVVHFDLNGTVFDEVSTEPTKIDAAVKRLSERCKISDKASLLSYDPREHRLDISGLDEKGNLATCHLQSRQPALLGDLTDIGGYPGEQTFPVADVRGTAIQTALASVGDASPTWAWKVWAEEKKPLIIVLNTQTQVGYRCTITGAQCSLNS